MPNTSDIFFILFDPHSMVAAGVVGESQLLVDVSKFFHREGAADPRAKDPRPVVGRTRTADRDRGKP